MSHLKISIDDQVLMDGDIGQWTAEPPRGVQDLVSKASGNTDPWHQAILVVMTHTIAAQKNATITVNTQADGWTLEVRN